LSTEGSLFRKAVRGSVWVVALSVSQEVIALARLVVLARLLSPNDFGLAGIAVLTLATVDTFTQPNFETALIQTRREIRPYLDSAWTAGILRGIAASALTFLVAPYAAAFFRAPESVPLIRAIALAVLAKSFTNIGSVYFRKELEFRKQFVWQFGGRLADFAVAMAAASLLHNSWALVLAFVAGDVAKLALSYWLHPYRPRLALDRARTREMFAYGKWVLGVGAIVFLVTQIDNALVGRLAGATMLGFYQLARRIANVPTTEIGHVVGTVAFPAYSKLQDRTPRLREGFLMALELTALAALPVAGAILALAGEITGQVFGEKWLPAAAAMQVLAAWGALGALQATAEPVLLAVGKPRALTKYQAVQLAALACLIYPMTARWDIRGAAVAVTLAAAWPSVLSLTRVSRITACGGATIVRTIALPAAGSALACAATLAVKHWALADSSRGLRLGLAAAVYAGVYAAFIAATARRLSYRVGQLIREAAGVLRSKAGGPASGPGTEGPNG